jgi:hypothetical protein
MSKGVEFSKKPKEVIEVLKETRGIAKRAWEKLGINRSCFYQYIRNNPIVKEAMKEIRETVDEDLKDLAEDTVFWAMTKREDHPRVGLSAARYVLDKKGHDRNWVSSEKNAGENNLRNSLGEINSQVDALYDSNDVDGDDQD